MKLLIADDSLVFRKTLEASVSKWGYEVLAVRDGKEAWEALQKDDAPRLAIFDWVMPGMNGIELCRKLKDRKEASYLYIILLTSKRKKEDIVEALESGADDFITKPFDANELKSRLVVGTRVLKYETALKEKKEELTRYASQMEQLAEERARQLIHADRMATLGTMSTEIAHEINNPLSFISTNLQLIHKLWEHVEIFLTTNLKTGMENEKKLRFVLKEMPNSLKAGVKGVSRIKQIVQGLQNYAHKGKGEMTACSINKCIEEALEICDNSLKYHVAIEKNIDKNLPAILANTQEIGQVFINLFINASHAIEPHGRGTLKITAGKNNRMIRTVVEDTGIGIPTDKLETIWDAFYTSKSKGKGTGLGLSISRQIINNHRGSIKAENRAEGGTRFIIELPFQDKR